MRLATTILLVGFTSFQSYSQVFEWAAHFANSGVSYSEAICIDFESSVITAGRFTTEMDFDPSPNSYILTPSGTGDGFIAKLDSSGALVWAKQLTGTGSAYIMDMELDSEGNIYCTGWFSDSVDFDPGPNMDFHVELSEDGGSQTDIFIIKLSNSGDLVWVRTFGAPTYSITGANWERGNALDIDGFSNVYVIGSFADTVDFDFGPDIHEVIVAPGERGAFILKVDQDGNFLWVKTWVELNPIDVAVDALGNPHITGKFNGLVDFDPGQNTYNLAAFNQAVFVSKLTSEGEFDWARKLGSGFWEEGNCIAVDNDGNVYSGGRFDYTEDFDPGPDEFFLTPIGTASQWDGYISKLDPEGQFVWAVGFGGSSHDEVRDLVIDSLGNVLCTGQFNGNAIFHPDTNKFGSPVFGEYSWMEDVFVASISSDGELVWSKRIGGQDDDSGHAIATDLSHNVYVTGLFAETVDFDPGPNISYLTGAFNYTPFVLKLAECSANHEVITTTHCGNYLSPSGNHIWETSGIYLDTLQSSVGCDSIIEINLTIIDADASVSFDFASQSLTTINPADSYQWLDCSQIPLPIEGASGQTFEPLTSGYYSVAISTNGCVDTSSCMFYNGVGIEENSPELSFNLFPNPTESSIVIELGSTIQLRTLKVYNNLGALTNEQNNLTGTLIQVELPDQSGIYLIQLVGEDGNTGIQKVVKW